MKKFVLSIIFVFCLFFSYSTASANHSDNLAEANVEINVNGEFIQTDVYPYLKDQHLLIPIRTLSTLGLSYGWDTSSNTVTIQNADEDTLIIKANSQVAYKNNNKIKMNIPAQMTNGRIFVPVRFITESLGYHVQYESIRRMVFITSNDYAFNMDSLNQEDKVAARRAAISLPLTPDFKTLDNPVSPFHEYIFLTGETNKYIYYNGHTGTIVEIKDGKAVVQGQYELGKKGILFNFEDFSGKITKMNIEDPLLKPYFLSMHGIVGFKNNGDGTMLVYYEYEHGTERATVSFTGSHSNLIQNPWEIERSEPRKKRIFVE
ncbi:copper amine oxidase N-terminal domain-containing protein [Bacillus solimangrovi]|uniref:Copper amine oxidase-like N-terminal domain-containing protein n=1 Tax=Bacillus solimangrovi TaxID=1305675 RepID=A0A1E5LD98_9BACI|nr:copper amine oxidase N-terminal domain-containing protein [Bacillus solimangrovi]OEH92051.1 hypothetical protein BFG57_16885 [Bacillus solimangrovi]